jgi:hypothetical protein
MNNRRQSRVESKSRNSGRVVSFILHSLLLLMLFLPIFAMKPPEEPTKEALVIQFDYPYNQYVKPEKFVQEENTDMASKMSGSEAGGSAASEEPKHSRPQEAAPSRLATPSVTSVMKTSSALRSNIGEIPLPTPKIVTQQAWQSVNDFSSFESDGVEEMKMIDWSDGGFGEIAGSGPGDGDDDSNVWSDGFGTGTGGTGGQGGGTGSQNGVGSGPGGGTGAGSAGKNTGVGQDGKGMSWGVGLDDGLLSRELVRRANVGSLAVKEGKVSIFICVDRSGMVISSKYDFAGSTLKDPAFVAKAEACASSYIFARDDDAPEKQCGKLAFIFKIK